MKYIPAAILTIGMLVLAAGAVAYLFRLNVLTGARIGPSLTPVYVILAGVAIAVVGLISKTAVDD
jgi:hypothetical protein